jgi:hypothetical protein
MRTHRRYSVVASRGTLETNSLTHALKLVAKGTGYRNIDDNRPEPKYRWLKQDILETR